MAELSVSADRPPLSSDNPRHAVWIQDDTEGPTRMITARNPGDTDINVDGVIYTHTAEDAKGRWIYTKWDRE